MKQSREQNEAHKLVGQINEGINRYLNKKLKHLCELDSSDDDDYGRNVYEQNWSKSGKLWQDTLHDMPYYRAEERKLPDHD